MFRSRQNPPFAYEIFLTDKSKLKNVFRRRIFGPLAKRDRKIGMIGMKTCWTGTDRYKLSHSIITYLRKPYHSNKTFLLSQKQNINKNNFALFYGAQIYYTAQFVPVGSSPTSYQIIPIFRPRLAEGPNIHLRKTFFNLLLSVKNIS